jgi:hypothetical protein
LSLAPLLGVSAGVPLCRACLARLGRVAAGAAIDGVDGADRGKKDGGKDRVNGFHVTG